MAIDRIGMKAQTDAQDAPGSQEGWTRDEVVLAVADIEGDFPLDEAVVEVLPRNSRVLSAEVYGTSAWTTTARVSTLLPDGTPKSYFLKCANGLHGRKMMLGEFTSVTEILKIMPGLLPLPYAWGKFKREDPSTYFLLSEFIDMDVVTAPEPMQFTAKVAQMHQRGTSPDGRFGFPVITCDGKMAHTVEWESSWAKFYAKLLLGVVKLDNETNGPLPKLEAATANMIDRVIPRMLGILQADGRQLKPSLLHGDLWEGNVGTNLETGEIILFDAGSYYGHNEMDLGIWRSACGQHFRSKAYTRNYLRNFPAAEPGEEFDDRNRLYSLKYNLNYSAGHPGSVTRQTAYNDMCYLSERYAPLEGLDKYNPDMDPSVTGARIVAHAGEDGK
jgi:protein-ribulosamine 3-kinase